jgi:hypothetical protein
MPHFGVIDDPGLRATLEAALVEATQSLLSHYGCDTTTPDAAGGDARPAALAGVDTAVGIIGLQAATWRATLVLWPSDGVLHATNPLPHHKAPHEGRDWCGELVNQLAGLFKRRLFALGLELGLTLPITVTGRDLSVVPALASNARWLDLSSTPGRVSVLLDVFASEEFQLDAAPSQAGDYLEEGACVLF